MGHEMRPLIGVTGNIGTVVGDKNEGQRVHLYRHYLECLVEAGAFAVIVPHRIPQIVAGMLDGWLIPGGDDLDPARWGEERHPETKLEDPSRVDFEMELWDQLDPAMPVLGICYGCQFLNVVHGGTVLQHVPDVVGNGSHSGGTLQHYRIEPGSKLSEALAGATEVEGKSFHHQAVGRLGDGLRVVANHEDGIVEGVERTDSRWVVGVQWHPERTPESAESQNLFRAFVHQAEAYRRSRNR